MGDGSSLQGVANTTNAAGRGSGPHCPPAAGSSSEDPPLSFSDRLPVLAGDLIDRVTATGLLEPGRSVLVLLSGGRDSVCLLDLAVRIVGSANVAALHCNYGLRQAADADERHCAGLCERLGVTRDETAAHCEARGLDWREDASNAAPEFARNRVRHELLPALRSLHPAAEANVLRTLELLRDEAAVIDAVVDDALARAGDPPALAALRELPSPLRRLALQRLADGAAPGGRAPAIGHRAGEVLALAEGGALDVGGGLRAEVNGGALRFGASRGPAAPHPRPGRP